MIAAFGKPEERRAGSLISALHKPVKRGKWKQWKRILALYYLILAVTSLYNYIDWRSAALVTGAVVLAFDPTFATLPTGNFRYGWGAFALLLLFVFIPVKTVLYLALAAAVLLFRESFHRKAGSSVPLVILLLSPVTNYAVQLFSFPIRLQLTEMAGKIIRVAGLPVAAAGNILTYKGREFTVDPACMGLHMLIVSLLVGLLLINYQQTRYRRRLHTILILLSLSLIVGLNIVANLFRIVLLVFFSILPDNPLHGVIGMAGLVIYVILPMFPLTRWLVRRYGRLVEDVPAGRAGRRSRLLLAGNWLVGISVLIAVVVAFVREIPGRGTVAGPAAPAVPGYTVTRLNGSVLRLNDPQSLVYIKPIPDFYYTDHSPMICWQGSGYVFERLQEREVEGVRIYEGVLIKGSETLYTAWWYDNGERHTTGQLDWRWDVIRGGHKYSIVNITTASREVLEGEVRRALRMNPFRKCLEQGF